MKKGHMAVLSVVLITGIAFAGSDNIMEKVVVKKAGYSIMLPVDWTVDQDDLKAGNLWPNVKLGDEVYVTFYIRKLKGKYDTVKKNLEENFLKEVFDPMEANWIEPKVITKASCSKVNGIEFCSAEFEYETPEGTQKVYFAVFKTKKGAYRMLFSSTPKTYDSQIDTFKEIIATIKLL